MSPSFQAATLNHLGNQTTGRQQTIGGKGEVIPLTWLGNLNKRTSGIVEGSEKE